jgi:hypothetical protein
MTACSRLSSAVGMGWVGVGWGLLLRVWALRARGGCGIDALCKVVGGWCKTGDVLYPGMIARLFSCSLGIPPAVAQEWSYQLGRISLVVPPACMKGVQLLVSDVVSLVLYAWTLARQPTMFVGPFSYISAIERILRVSTL